MLTFSTLAAYRRAMEVRGQSVTLRRYAGLGAQRAALNSSVLRAVVTGYQPEELIGGMQQGDRRVLLLAEDVAGLTIVPRVWDAPVIVTPSPFVTTDTSPEIAGTMVSDVTDVIVYLDGEPAGEAALGSGTWTYEFDALDIGTYEVRARAVDAAGNQSGLSAPFVLTVNAPLTISGEPATEAILNAGYEWFGTVSGGVKPYSPSLHNAAPGMQVEMVDDETYRVFGPLTEPGTFEGIVVQVEDSE